MKLLFEDRAVQLHHGDALAVRPDVRANAIIIDPPYARGGGVHNGRQSVRGLQSEEAGADQFFAFWFRSVAERLTAATLPTGHGFIFCDEDTFPLVKRGMCDANGWRVTQALVWDREATGMGSPFRAAHEMIAFARGPEFKWAGSKSLRDVIRCRWPYGEHPNHEAEKPADLLIRLMTEYSDAPVGSLWLDGFMGSATSAVAAARCGRRLWGCELDGERAEMAVRRYREDTAQAGMFGGAR
jgi:DNA modification methylase